MLDSEQTNENAPLLSKARGRIFSRVGSVSALYGSDEETTVSNRTTRAVYENLSSDSTLPIAGCAAHCVVLDRQRCPKSNDSLVRISTSLPYSPIQWGGRGGMSTSCLNRSAPGE